MKNRQAGAKNKKVLIILGVVVLIALIALAGFYFVHKYGSTKTNNPTPALSAEDAKAQADLKAQIDKETDKEKKSQLMYDYGDYYVNSNQYDKALQNAMDIEKLNPTAQSASTIAYIYNQMGDYKNAVKYYELAMSRTDKPVSESANSPYNDYRVLKEAAEAKL